MKMVTISNYVLLLIIRSATVAIDYRTIWCNEDIDANQNS